MSEDEFRSSAQRVGAMQALIQNPVFHQMMECLRDSRPSAVVADNADVLTSVRTLAEIAQHESDVSLILRLGTPLPPEPEEEKPTWGQKQRPQGL